MNSLKDSDLDSLHSEILIEDLGMKKLKHHNINYLVYELDEIIYYFEKIDDRKLRLFCKTTKNSFYLS